MSDTFAHAVSRHLRALALAFPEVHEGQSCVNRAFKARKKNFLFVGEKGDQIRVMVKLGPSLDAARERAAADDRVTVGKTGWATLSFPAHDPLPGEVLARWVDESFRLLAAKTLVRTLPDTAPRWPGA